LEAAMAYLNAVTWHLSA